MKKITPLFLALSLSLATLPNIAFANLEEGSAAYIGKDFGKAFQVLLPIAQQGNSQAQRLVGNMYLNGTGVATSEVDAAQWFRLSAEQGDKAAMESLGSIYVQGRGVAQDLREATKWFRRAQDVPAHRNAEGDSIEISAPSSISSRKLLASCKQVPPIMPRLAIQSGSQGTVKAAFLMDGGVTKDVVIYSGPKVFHEAVRKALLQYDCSPLKVHTLGTQEFVFAMDEGAATKPQYTIVQQAPAFGSGPPPFNSNWYGLSNEQKLVVKGQYTNLQVDDEPPYPTEGMGELVENIRVMAEYLGIQGRLRFDVKIGPDGKVETVNVLETPDPALSKQAAAVVYRATYKAALCGKQACAMSLPIDVAITRVKAGEKRTAPDELSALSDAADRGDPSAQNELGERYASGRGVFRDMVRAVKWYQQSADRGNRTAQMNLARAFATGQGTKKDWQQALEWLRKAAEQGEPSAQHSLGSAYMRGDGITKDQAEGVKWLQKSADQGYSSAQNNLGDAYENGHGVALDLVQALKWYRLAADQKNRTAFYSLSLLYADGRGVERDPDMAIRMLQEAAGLGSPDAQFELAQLYADGKGVDKDTDMAVKWYRKAAQGGFKKAVDKLKELGIKM